MSVEKERYKAKLKEIEERIGNQKTIVYQAERELSDLKRELKNAEDSCRHKLDDGKTAMIEKRGWVSNMTTHYNSYTDEYEDSDDGYTSYYNECQICGYDDEE